VNPRLSVAVLALALSFVAASAHGANVKLTFERASVVAEGVTEGGDVVWFAVLHDPQRYHERTLELATIVKDTDRDGVVRLDLKRDIPRESLWVVVDLSSGKRAIEQPLGTKIRVAKIPEPRYVKGNGNAASSVMADYDFVHLWLIRPSVGAWTLTVEDGGRGDADRTANDAVLGELDAFQPVDGLAPPPVDLMKGDLLFAVDPLRLGIAEVVAAN
jgi:hypothetical protein